MQNNYVKKSSIYIQCTPKKIREYAAQSSLKTKGFFKMHTVQQSKKKLTNLWKNLGVSTARIWYYIYKSQRVTQPVLFIIFACEFACKFNRISQKKKNPFIFVDILILFHRSFFCENLLLVIISAPLRFWTLVEYLKHVVHLTFPQCRS